MFLVKRFKLWDNQKNDWWTPDEFTNGWIIFPTGHIQILGATDFISASESKAQNRYILVQYCGWIDSKGNEVYEYDLIKAHYRNGDEFIAKSSLGMSLDMEMSPEIIGTTLKKEAR